MTVKELCAITNDELCIVIGKDVKARASETKSLGTENQIPSDLLDCEIDSLDSEMGPFDWTYLKISLKPLDK